MSEKTHDNAEQRLTEKTRHGVAIITEDLRRVASDLDELAATNPDEQSMQTKLTQFSIYERRLFSTAGLPGKRINEILTEISEGMRNPLAIEMITDRIKTDYTHGPQELTETASDATQQGPHLEDKPETLAELRERLRQIHMRKAQGQHEETFDRDRKTIHRKIRALHTTDFQPRVLQDEQHE